MLLEEEIWACFEAEGIAEPTPQSIASFHQAASLQSIFRREGMQDGHAISVDGVAAENSKVDINDFMAKVLSQLRSFAHEAMQKSLSKE